MSEPIDSLPNLGPKTARMLEEVGIATVADLRAIGAVDAWRRIKFAYPKRVSLVGLYAIEAALRGCPWTGLSGAEREALRRSAASERPGVRARGPRNKDRGP
jgi:DNA transformation protein